MGGSQDEVAGRFDYVFPENGLVAYENGKLKGSKFLVIRFLDFIHLAFWQIARFALRSRNLLFFKDIRFQFFQKLLFHQNFVPIWSSGQSGQKKLRKIIIYKTPIFLNSI